MRVVDKEEFYTALSMIDKRNDNMSPKAVNELYDLLLENNIDNAERMAVFLANAAHESSYLRRKEENLNYSAKRLRQIWPSRFTRNSVAEKYAYNPKALANYVYNGRMGNREDSDDGWIYRGGGFFQLTGSRNYKRAQKQLGIPLHDNPDLVRQEDKIAWVTAIHYFVSRRYQGKSLLEWADLGSHRNVCRAINGGLHGLAERKMIARSLYEVFGETEGLFTMPLLKRGERGAHVRQLQRKLKDLGYPIYNVDGVYGGNTDKAVKLFQSDHGLVVDGIMGGRTYTRLNDLIEQVKDLTEYDHV